MDGIRIKSSVRFDPRTVARPEFWLMTDVAQETAPSDYFVTITSARDSKHKQDSKHYKGWAKDYRIKDFPGTIWEEVSSKLALVNGLKTLENWVERIQKRLGGRYFVQLELKKYHIHIQYNYG